MAGLFTSALDIAPTARPASSLRSAIPDFLALTKPEVNFLIVIATLTGFYLGYPGDLNTFPVGRLLNALLGTLLVASGTGTLNQYLGRLRCADATHPQTPGCRRQTGTGDGRMVRRVAFLRWRYLPVRCQSLASAPALFTVASYLLIYTPLKPKTPLCTLVGGFPGAIPLLIGWAAASGSITSGNLGHYTPFCSSGSFLTSW